MEGERNNIILLCSVGFFFKVLWNQMLLHSGMLLYYRRNNTILVEAFDSVSLDIETYRNTFYQTLFLSKTKHYLVKRLFGSKLLRDTNAIFEK